MSEALHAKVGEAFDVALEAVPTAGFRWEVSIPAEGSGLLTLDGSDWEPRTSLAGGSALQRFHFRGVAAGSVTLHFRYRRPWEGMDREQRAMTVTIDEGG